MGKRHFYRSLSLMGLLDNKKKGCPDRYGHKIPKAHPQVIYQTIVSRISFLLLQLFKK